MIKKTFNSFLVCYPQRKPRVITFTVPDQEIAIIENDVPDAFPMDQDAWTGKLAKRKNRLIEMEIFPVKVK